MPAFQVADMTGRDPQSLRELRLREAEALAHRDDSVFVHDLTSHIARLEARGYPRNYVSDPDDPTAQTARMGKKAGKKAANHLRAWREYRRMTQEELAVKVGTAGNVIGLLESGERGLSDKWLRKLAPALGTRPGFLLEFAPDDVNREMLELTLDLPEHQKPQALQILRVLKTGTDG